MNSGFNLESRKNHITEIKKSLELHDEKANELKSAKEKTMEVHSALYGLGLDESVERKIADTLGDELLDIKKQASDAAEIMDKETSRINEIHEEVAEEKEKTLKAIDKMKTAQEFLSSIGLGNVLEKGISEAEEHMDSVEDLRIYCNDVEKETASIQEKLRNIM